MLTFLLSNFRRNNLCTSYKKNPNISNEKKQEYLEKYVKIPSVSIKGSSKIVYWMTEETKILYPNTNLEKLTEFTEYKATKIIFENAKTKDIEFGYLNGKKNYIRKRILRYPLPEEYKITSESIYGVSKTDIKVKIIENTINNNNIFVYRVDKETSKTKHYLYPEYNFEVEINNFHSKVWRPEKKIV